MDMEMKIHFCHSSDPPEAETEMETMQARHHGKSPASKMSRVPLLDHLNKLLPTSLPISDDDDRGVFMNTPRPPMGGRNRYRKMSEEEDDDEPKSASANATPNQEEEAADLSCGLGKCRTNVFGKWFSNLYVFTFLMSMEVMFSHMINGVIPTQLQSLERQFDIGNQQISWLSVLKNAGSMITLIWAGHFLRNSHIPVIIGFAGIFEGILFSIPALMQSFDPYTLDTSIFNGTTVNESTTASSHDLCFPPDVEKEFISDGVSLEIIHADRKPFYVLLVIAACTGVIGIFQSQAVANLYIDDNLMDKTKMPIFFCMRSLIQTAGGPIGGWLNGYFTEVPVDLKNYEMEPKDPRFVGAWWLVMLILGLLAIANALPLSLLPRRLVTRRQQIEALKKADITFAGGRITEDGTDDEEGKTTNENTTTGDSGRKESKADASNGFFAEEGNRSINVSGATESESTDVDATFEERHGNKTTEEEDLTKLSTKKKFFYLLKDFPRAFRRVFTNPQYVIVLAESCIVAIPNTGLAIFKKSYIFFEYNVTMKEVSYYSSYINTATHIVGILTSSWLASRVKTKMGYLWIIFGTYMVGTVVCPFYVLLGCDNEPVYGLNGSHIGRPIDTASLGCNCSQLDTLLSCGADDRNYLSPCFAGCTKTDGETYSDCQLVENGTTVTPGLCPVPDKCFTNFILNIALHGLQSVFEEMNHIPRSLFLLRLVDSRDRAFALAIAGVIYNLVILPAPIMFGGFMDSLCVAQDGGHCVLYDRDTIRYLVGGLDVATHLCVQLLVIVIMLMNVHSDRKQRKLMEEEKRTASIDDHTELAEAFSDVKI